MEVKLAKSAGFCFGVKRAMDKVYDQIENHPDQKIYTYGPIIHNEVVVKELEDRGVEVINDISELSGKKKGIIIIRSHGVPRKTGEEMVKAGFQVVDATCPFVKRIHNIVQEKSKEGREIIIVGNPNHPEVEGIKGWCEGPVEIIESVQEAEKLSEKLTQKACIVSQTTFNYNKFKDIVDIFEKKVYDINVVNTICNATQERQKEAEEIASEADVMIVIGGAHSSNSKKLYEICRGECGNTHFIQTLDDLHLELPKSVRLVGITAGASTPNNIIEEVQNYVRINF